MKPQAKEVFAQVDRLIEEAGPEELPALSVALSARVSVATARLLEAPPTGLPHRHAPDENLSVDVAAKRLGVSKSFLYKRKKLPFRKKIGSRVLFSARGLQTWAEQQHEA